MNNYLLPLGSNINLLVSEIKKKLWDKQQERKGAIFLKKYLTQVTTDKFQAILNYFDLSHSEFISSYFGLSQSILGYLVIS